MAAGMRCDIIEPNRWALRDQCVWCIGGMRDCDCFKSIESLMFQSSKRRRDQARLLTSDSPQKGDHHERSTLF
ncbi:hypothetical protein SAMN05443582_102882 [Phyllobacterium sp. OV277]|nr:hypothetical protein SAMN05443582_102882 [Phyllobacterium sp. OV277]